MRRKSPAIPPRTLIHRDQWDVVYLLGSSGRWTGRCIAKALFGNESYTGRVHYMLSYLGVSILKTRNNVSACERSIKN